MPVYDVRDREENCTTKFQDEDHGGRQPGRSGPDVGRPRSANRENRQDETSSKDELAAGDRKFDSKK